MWRLENVLKIVTGGLEQIRWFETKAHGYCEEEVRKTD